MSIPPDVAHRLLNAGYVAEAAETGAAGQVRPPARSSIPPPVARVAEGAGAPPLPVPPKMSVEDLTLLITALSGKINEERQQMSINTIKTNMDKQSEENRRQLEKIQESLDKASEAKKSGVWGKVFGWIATAAAVVAAVALCATGAGAVVGGLLLAGAIVGLANQVLKEIPAVQQWMADHPAVGWAVMVAQCVLAIASCGAGLFSAAKAVVDTSVKVAAQVIAKAANLLEGGAAIGAGASGVATALINGEAADARIDAKEIQAIIQKLQGMLDDEMARLKKLMEEAEEGVSLCMSIMSSATQTKQSVIGKMAV